MPLVMQLPSGLQRKLETACLGLAVAGQGPGVDFSNPLGEEALIPQMSVSWRVFKNPITVFIGGIAAVILELAEPSVRTGVWEHSRFRDDPRGRLQRTGTAALLTVYGARSVAKPLIERVVRMHARVHGVTPQGVPFSASDPDLLGWVHGTAAYGFLTAYSRYARPLTGPQMDDFYCEGVEVARLYGAAALRSRRDIGALFQATQGRLERSPILFEFLDIMRDEQLFPRPLLWLQRMLVRAAVEIVPRWARERVGLGNEFGLRPLEGAAIRMLSSFADQLILPGSAPALACARLGLPATYLYR
jgi:uncharacterized protein (DUF2236 family)